MFISLWDQATVLLCALSASLLVYQLFFFNHNIYIYLIGYLLDVWWVYLHVKWFSHIFSLLYFVYSVF